MIRRTLSATADLAALLLLALASWWLHRLGAPLPLPTQTLLLGVAAGQLLACVPRWRDFRPAADVPLSVGMVLLGAQVDAGALGAVGIAGVLLVLLHHGLTGWCVRSSLHVVGEARVGASLASLGLGGGSLSAVLSAHAAAARPDDRARDLAVLATLLAAAVGFVALPTVADALMLATPERARWAGICMPTSPDAVLVGAMHAPETMRATGALRFVVTLLLWLPLLGHLRRVAPPRDAGCPRPAAGTVLAAITRVPGFVFGLALLTVVALAGGLTADEVESLARATNWAFLMVLASVGMTLRLRALRAVGLRPLAAAVLGWAVATAILLGVVVLVGRAEDLTYASSKALR